MSRETIRWSAVLGLTSFGLIATTMVTEGSQGQRLRANLQTTSRLVAPPEGRCADEDGHAPVIGLLEAMGAGETNLLGTVVDEQSHCVRADGTFFGGRFTLTNADGRTIRGLYFGNLAPTFNSTFTPAPGGTWLIHGNVCVLRHGGEDVDESGCEARDYRPAHGITSLATGDGTIFLDQTVD